jgi:hypothetical protein
MKARIYRPARTAMQQSGQADNNHWLLEFVPQSSPYIDPLMGWTGMTDTTRELYIKFTTQEEAIDYAKRNHIEFELKEPEPRKIKPKSYAANFTFNRIRETQSGNQ